jgi:riboflavin biosynthesis pyrimidine reductase
MQIADWEERFHALVERKTRTAAAAALSPFATERDDAAETLAAIGNAWSRTMFGGLFYVSQPATPSLPAGNLVFVQSREGNTATSDPATLGGGEADTHLIYEGLSRVAADAVMGGARTIGAGRMVLSVWRPELVALRNAMALPRHPTQIVATLGGLALDRGVMFNVPELPVIVVTVPSGAEAMRTALEARPWISLVVMDNPNDLAGAFRQLRQLGIERLSCIGGRTLAARLLDAGLVQDVYLTTGTKSGGEPNTPVSVKPLNGREMVRKRGTGPDEGVLFQHVVLS